MCIALGGEYSDESGYINNAMTDSKNLYEWAFDNFTDNIDISIDKRFESVQLGSTVQLNAEITGSNINAVPEIKWSSSNPDEEFILGDVDGDGEITVKDATLIQKFAVELEALSDKQRNAADINGDCTISILDATVIQKYVAGLIAI